MRIGYACITLGTEDTQLKGLTLKNATSERLQQITASNLSALEKMIEYNIRNGIRLFRISSDIIPFGSHPVNREKWWEENEEALERIGEKSRKSCMRLSMHPGQYTVLNSINSEVVKKAIKDLEYHCLFLDSLGMDNTNKVILHIGGIFGDKKAAVDRFKKNYSKLDDGIKKRLVIENDEKCFSIDSVYEISQALNIPIVFDNLHNSINPACDDLGETDWIQLCGKTWKAADGNQKIHYSQKEEGVKIGAHSQSIAIDSFLKFYNVLKDKDIDIMLEVKDKNLSAVKCNLCIHENVSIKLLMKEWDRYRHLVLEHSQEIYLKIEELFDNGKKLRPIQFFEYIEEAEKIEIHTEGRLNAVRHIWGYFSGISNEKEKNQFRILEKGLESGTVSVKRIKGFLWQLSKKYSSGHMNEEYYFIP